MIKRTLGQTGIEVTELCFGALPMGPLQKDLSIEENSRIIEFALKKGVNFIDTAQMYRTYEPISMAMKNTGIRPVIASKSNKKTYEDMQAAVNEALEMLDIDCIDIFHLHAAREGENAFLVFAEALRCLADMKNQGKIKAIGISTHSVAVTSLAAEQPLIDIVFPIINMKGLGIIDGTKEEMAEAIKKAHKAGKGIYLMKALAGGGLIGQFTEALEFVRSIEGYASIAIGITSIEEAEYNIAYFSGQKVEGMSGKIPVLKKALVSRNLCKGCGKCMSSCPNKAISFDEEKKASIDKNLCLTCGYCTPVCPEFAIRIV